MGDLDWPADATESLRALGSVVLGPDSWCCTCGAPVGGDARVLVDTRSTPACAAVRHERCATPPEPYAGRGQQRLVCSALPDGRPVLVANVDVDMVAIDATGQPALVAPLCQQGWAAWPAPPNRVDGWVDPGRAVVTVLGEWPVAAPEQWWTLVARHGELVVLVLADRHVADWATASGFAEIAAWIDDAIVLAALVRAAPSTLPAP